MPCSINKYMYTPQAQPKSQITKPFFWAEHFVSFVLKSGRVNSACGKLDIGHPRRHLQVQRLNKHDMVNEDWERMHQMLLFLLFCSVQTTGSVSMCVFVCVVYVLCVCIHIYMYIYMHIYMYIYVCIYMYMSIYISVCVCVCVFFRM